MSEESVASVETFETPAAWESWLEANGHDAREIWLRIAKRGAGFTTVTYDEALDVALCHGWIDGRRNAHDDASFVQRFTPRRPKGLWSRRNVAKADALIEAGRMRSAGLAEIEAARVDGRWESAYASQSEMTLPDDLVAAFAEDAEARARFAALSKAERYGILLALHKLKSPASRARRIAALLTEREPGRATEG